MREEQTDMTIAEFSAALQDIREGLDQLQELAGRLGMEVVIRKKGMMAPKQKVKAKGTTEEAKPKCQRCGQVKRGVKLRSRGRMMCNACAGRST